MKYVIQENVFKSDHYQSLIDNIERLGFDYDIVRSFPFVDKVTKISDIPESFSVDDLPDYDPGNEKVFVFGAIKLARIAKSSGWNPGSMMNDNHDFLVYKEFYKDNLLNYDSIVTNFSEIFLWPDDNPRFIRPCADTKAFTGKIFQKTEWNEFVSYHISNGHDSILDANTKIQVSKVKSIQKEIRFWCVGGEIITGSQYRMGNQTVYDNLYDKDAFLFAKKMVDLYKIADAFVIDVCLNNNEWKIVELNCINCSGFYKSDVRKIVCSVNDYFESK